MKRVREPVELMDDVAQAEAYAAADFSEPNALFLECFATHFGERFAGRVIDLGCGPGDIAMGFATRYPECVVDVLDGAAAMLAIARRKLVDLPQLSHRINLQYATLPCSRLPRQAYDAVLSNSLLHHLSDPGVMWQTVKHCAKPGAALCIMDLVRPASTAAAAALVATYAADEPQVLRRDFRHSLHAAYSLAEVALQLRKSGLDGCAVHCVSDRHLAVFGRAPFR
jgi:ubiquinone/menaquinone biosynthesis C-methylase UbiE